MQELRIKNTNSVDYPRAGSSGVHSAQGTADRDGANRGNSVAPARPLLPRKRDRGGPDPPIRRKPVLEAGKVSA